jgi:hypothetical protein
MSTVPLLRPREVVKAFEKLGWQVARQKGSHMILTKEGLSLLSLSPTIRKWREGHCEASSREPD